MLYNLNVPPENPFEFFGVHVGATELEIKSAYRRKLKQLHPDKNPGAPPHIVVQLAEFTQQLNDAYHDLILNLEKYRNLYGTSQKKSVSKDQQTPNPFGFSESIQSRLQNGDISEEELDQLRINLEFPRMISNLSLTALRIRTLLLRKSPSFKFDSLKLALFFVIGSEVAQFCFQETVTQSIDILDLQVMKSTEYVQGVIDDADYFLSVEDSDFESFKNSLALVVQKWISREANKESQGSQIGEKYLVQAFLSGFLFILFQV